MPDDWSWFWAGERGRDNLLRDELEGLQSTAYAASQQSARLSSQLRTLQGSIESRLQALSTAFDAYVELGDVREQLAAHPATSAVRRDALRALAVLEQGGLPEPLEAPEVSYWLVDAVNEVVALVGGAEPARSTGGAQRQEHETFVVAALGWLGHGGRVADRVAPLLMGDGALAAPQVVLWRALVHGVLGPALPTVREAWRRDLDLSASTWDRFAGEVGRAAGPAGTLRWVDDLVRGAWAPSATSSTPATADDRVELRRLVEALVQTGTGDERVLLERARVLRRRIEDPGTPEPDHDAEPARTRATVLVQEALRDPRVSPAARAELVTWVRPGIDAAVAQLASSVAGEQPRPQVVHTELGPVEVSGAGPDEARLAALDRVAVERFTPSPTRVLVPGTAAAVAAVAGLVLLVADVTGLGVLLLVVAAVLGAVLVREVLRARTARAELAGVRERTRQRVEEGRASAAAADVAARHTRAEVAALARAITGQPVPTPPQTTATALR